jgi:thiol-disulfide isomerase/thioredoxin
MTNKLKHYAKEIITFCLMLFIAANIVSYYRSIDLNKNKLTLQELQLLTNEKFIYDKDKALLVHFWATWCPVCKVEAANIQAVSQKYNVLSIATDSGSNSKVKAYMKAHNVNFKVYNDKDSSLTQNFNIQVFPTSFIYNNNQELVFSEVGYTSTLGLSLRMWWAEL